MGYGCHPNNNNKTCVPLISFKRTSANITLHARKEPHFGGHNTLQGECTPFLKKNVQKESALDLCHCTLLNSQMLSQECDLIIKTQRIGTLQSL